MRHRRAIDVQLEVSANGTRVLGAKDAAPATAPAELEEPCTHCQCCTRWAAHLELLHAAIVEHNRRQRAASNFSLEDLLGVPARCPDGCLVCTAGETW